MQHLCYYEQGIDPVTVKMVWISLLDRLNINNSFSIKIYVSNSLDR